MSRIKELEKLHGRIEKAALEAVRQREYSVSSILEDALEKVAQKIEGHRASRRRKK